jgi:hypothetical protein
MQILPSVYLNVSPIQYEYSVYRKIMNTFRLNSKMLNSVLDIFFLLHFHLVIQYILEIRIRYIVFKGT